MHIRFVFSFKLTSINFCGKHCIFLVAYFLFAMWLNESLCVWCMKCPNFLLRQVRTSYQCTLSLWVWLMYTLTVTNVNSHFECDQCKLSLWVWPMYTFTVTLHLQCSNVCNMATVLLGQITARLCCASSNWIKVPKFLVYKRQHPVYNNYLTTCDMTKLSKQQQY